jgi:hypothetical protein
MPDPTLERLDDQIGWYDLRSIRAQRWYKGLKLIQVGSGAIIPFLAGIHAPPWSTASFGVLIVILEGIKQLNQYQHNWIIYRSTCEYLKHEKYLFAAKAGPYSKAENPTVLLAERIESLVSQEHANWFPSKDHEKDSGHR